MADKQIDLKTPLIAGILAFLIPGAGHFYQGRRFKATIYFTCILGLFFSGMVMADWQAIKPPSDSKTQRFEQIKYVGQLAVGLPAMYGLVQQYRYSLSSNTPPETLDRPIVAPFRGMVGLSTANGLQEEMAEGTIELVPAKGLYGGNAIAGELRTDINGQPQVFQLGPSVILDRPVKASRARRVNAEIVQEENGQNRFAGQIDGEIPRSFLNWYQVPMDDHEVQDLHRRLGKYHEMAMVFTWIAGLLNILAIWDSVEGPAYGYDDKDEQPDEQGNSPQAVTS